MTGADSEPELEPDGAGQTGHPTPFVRIGAYEAEGEAEVRLVGGAVPEAEAGGSGDAAAVIERPTELVAEGIVEAEAEIGRVVAEDTEVSPESADIAAEEGKGRAPALLDAIPSEGEVVVSAAAAPGAEFESEGVGAVRIEADSAFGVRGEAEEKGAARRARLAVVEDREFDFPLTDGVGGWNAHKASDLCETDPRCDDRKGEECSSHKERIWRQTCRGGTGKVRGFVVGWNDI